MKLNNLSIGNTVISITLVVCFAVSLGIMFLPSSILSMVLTFINIFIPVSVFAMFLSNNVKVKSIDAT